MNKFKIFKCYAIVAFAIGLIFVAVGVVQLLEQKTHGTAITYLFVVGGIIIGHVGYILNNQVKLQSHLTRIEDKIDSIVNNS